MGLGGPPEPTGRPGGPGLWRHKGLELPAPIQRVAMAIMREKGLPRSQAIALAVGAVKHFVVGKQYSPKTHAAAAAGVADWEAKRAFARGASAARDITSSRPSGSGHVTDSRAGARREGSRQALMARATRPR